MKNIFIKAVMILTTILIISLKPYGDAWASEKTDTYITVEAFAANLAKELEIAPVKDSYMEGLKTLNLIKEGEFLSPQTNITRGDAMVLLNRADELLYGDQLDGGLVQLAIDKRISDIRKVQEEKKADVAKAYLKGYMKGHSNGAYCTDRELKVTKKITREGALSCIVLLKDMSKRAKISPDGQLIRTKNLPIMAKKYPYILESYPNEYYDWRFDYEGVTRYVNNKEVNLIDGVDYAAPVDVNKITLYGDMTAIRAERTDKWINDAKVYFNNVLNVDYRTIDESWIDKMIETNDAFKYNEEMMRASLERYVKNMKKNKTIVECSRVDIDPSSLYFFGSLYLRVHVKYRVVSTDILLNMPADTLHETKLHNSILYSPYFVNIRQKKLGVWQDGYYEVNLGKYWGKIGGSTVAFDDAVYLSKKVIKN